LNNFEILAQASALLQNIQSEINESKRSVAALQQQTSGLDDAKGKLADLEAQLIAKMGRCYRSGWEKWLTLEQLRDSRAPNAQNPPDIVALHESLPKEQDAMRESCKRLREEIGQQRKRRKDVFDELARAEIETGTGSKMAEYKRLVAAGCGGISTEEVETALPALLETLQSEDITQAWRTSAQKIAAATG